MSLRIRCPSCKILNIVPSGARVRKIDCVGCDRRFTIPDQDEDEAIQQDRKLKTKAAPVDDGDDLEDDRPRRKKRKSDSGKGSSTTMLIIVGGVLIGVFVLCGVGGVLIYVAMRSVGGAIERVANAEDRKRRGNNRDFNVVAKGLVVFDQNGNLNPNDPADPTPDLVIVNARMKVHQIALKPGKAYVITLDSDDFDAYLRVESPQGERLVEDDDSGGALNSRIVFRPQQAGNYRIIATSWDGDFGRYRLRVQEAD